MLPTRSFVQRNVLLLVFVLLSICTTALPVQAQNWMPVLTNEVGDTIPYVYPPPDSAYIPDELIVKFRKGSLDYSKLCYTYSHFTANPKQEKALGISDYQISALMAQRFDIDSIVIDTTLRSAIRSFGGTKLRRITHANPCADTVSITRRGDTLIGCDDFNWMVLELDNDTSVIKAATMLTIFYQPFIEGAEPNYIGELARDPGDPQYTGAPQTSIRNLIGAPRAWDNQVSSDRFKVGVVDNGVYYNHCDLGGGMGAGYKVRGGWNYTENNSNIGFFSDHGTPVAGIIGALSNRNCATPTPEGVAGIAGGWGPLNGATDEGLGVQLYGYRTTVSLGRNAEISLDFALAAIRRASAYNPLTGYGDGVHVLNNSYRFPGAYYTEALRSAVNYAYEHSVLFVASRGNDRNNSEAYPACFDSPWVTSVGAGDFQKDLIFYSSYGRNVDVIAPGGRSDAAAQPWEKIVRTTQYPTGYTWFSGTSAAAPHVSGVYALLLSEVDLLWAPDPEDYEGMIKASAEDRNLANYDNETGWGHLQADRLFEMIDDGYKLSYFNSRNLQYTYGGWSSPMRVAFFNGGAMYKPLASGSYTVKRRTVSATITLPSGRWIVDNDHPLFVWGMGGSPLSSGGYSAANPNYQTNYTRMTSGTGGNGLVDGIIHSHSLQVQVTTFQYEVWDLQGRYAGLHPSTDQLMHHIGVFGKRITTSVQLSDEVETPEIGIFPNPADDVFTVRYAVETPSRVELCLLNTLGQQIVSVSPEVLGRGTYSQEIHTASLPPGVYYCRLTLNGVSTVRPVTIVR